MPAPEFPWERDIVAALSKGKAPQMPDDLTLTDQLAFQALVHLYSWYNLKKIDREQASEQKKSIRGAWEKQKSLDAFDRKLAAHSAAVALATEKYKRDFLHATTVADAIQAAKTMIEKMDNIPLDLSEEVLKELEGMQ